jgi:antitoxin VapB
MTKEYRAKVFKSGNSLALRLPKGLGVTEGTEMVVREAARGFTFQPVDAPKRKFDIDAIWGIARGSGMVPFEPHERLFEERSLLWDDPEWRAKHMPDE